MKGKKLFFKVVVLAVFLAAVLRFAIYLPDKTVSAQQSTDGLIYVADVVSVQGDGFLIKRVNSPHYIRGRRNMADYKHDILETDGNTVACIEFHNGSQIGINKNTTIEIITSSGVRDLTQRSTVEKVILKGGVIWAKVRGQKSTFDVETGKGVFGVKGTEFVIESDPEADKEEVTVLEGSVEYSAESGEAFTLEPGNVLSIVPGQPLSPVTKGIDELRQILDGRFPNMDPRAQAVMGVFSAHISGQVGAYYYFSHNYGIC